MSRPQSSGWCAFLAGYGNKWESCTASLLLWRASDRILNWGDIVVVFCTFFFPVFAPFVATWNQCICGYIRIRIRIRIRSAVDTLEYEGVSAFCLHLCLAGCEFLWVYAEKWKRWDALHRPVRVPIAVPVAESQLEGRKEGKTAFMRVPLHYRRVKWGLLHLQVISKASDCLFSG
jgi:hypothetical protein